MKSDEVKPGVSHMIDQVMGLKQDFRYCDRSGDGVDGGLVNAIRPIAKRKCPNANAKGHYYEFYNLLFKYACVLHPHQSLTAIHFLLFDEISATEQS